MRIEESNGIRILHPEYGYLLKNMKTGDIHSGKVYLENNSSVEDYEEMRDETISEGLIFTLNDVRAKEESLKKIGKLVASQVTDDTIALSIQEFYDIWVVGVTYNVGQYVKFNDILYKVMIQHISRETWTPDVAVSLFAKVLIDPTGETIPEWVQPDSTNGYMTGDKVMYEGVIYKSAIDNNIWSPADYPAGWQVLEG